MNSPRTPSGAIRFVEIFDEDLCAEVRERRIFLLTTSRIDEILNVQSLLGDRGLSVEMHLLPDGEEQKQFRVFQEVLEHLAQIKFPRDGVIIAVGGGATTDVAGFVAASWMRGVDWIAIPTTLAAMVDAAIGGKTGINLDSGKNLVGAFHLPRSTVIDRRLLSSLDRRDFVAGMAEIIKCGMIDDPEILELAESYSIDDFEAGRNQEILDALIERSVAVKNRIVSKDLRESGERVFLNYGHTLGHAIEVLNDYRLRHGEAVSMGMVFAASLSERVLGLDPAVVLRQRKILESFGLPTSLIRMTLESLVAIMERDKKVQSGKMRFVLLKGIAEPKLVESIEMEVLESVFVELANGA